MKRMVKVSGKKEKRMGKLLGNPWRSPIGTCYSFALPITFIDFEKYDVPTKISK